MIDESEFRKYDSKIIEMEHLPSNVKKFIKHLSLMDLICECDLTKGYQYKKEDNERQTINIKMILEQLDWESLYIDLGDIYKEAVLFVDDIPTGHKMITYLWDTKLLWHPRKDKDFTFDAVSLTAIDGREECVLTIAPKELRGYTYKEDGVLFEGYMAGEIISRWLESKPSKGKV